MNDKEKLIEQLLSQMNKIFFFCVKRCNSRIDAEDLSQDILLDIIVNINKGINIKNFNHQGKSSYITTNSRKNSW